MAGRPKGGTVVERNGQRFTEAEQARIGALHEPDAWDDPGWLTWNGHDRQWARDAWAGLARMAEARQAAGEPVTDGDRRALRRAADIAAQAAP